MHFTILIPCWYKINIVKRIWRRKVMGVTTGYHTVSNRQSCEWLSKRDSRSFYLQIIRVQQGIITNILLLTSRVKNWCQVFFQMTATQHHCEAVWNFLSFFIKRAANRKLRWPVFDIKNYRCESWSWHRISTKKKNIPARVNIKAIFWRYESARAGN